MSSDNVSSRRPSIFKREDCPKCKNKNSVMVSMGMKRCVVIGCDYSYEK